MGVTFKNVIMPKKPDADTLKQIASELKKAQEDRNMSTTYFWRIGYDVSNGWFIAAGWMDGFDPDELGSTERLCFKIAYMPEHSLLTDYDYDFVMPYDKDTGEVWDTEVSTEQGVTEASLLTDLNWLMKEFDEMVKLSRECMGDEAESV